MTGPDVRIDGPEVGAIGEAAEYMAKQVCLGFQAHDEGDRDGAVDAFFEVDRRQFAHVDDREARAAAAAYVDALWAKDRIEDRHRRDGVLDRQALAEADWGPVAGAFRERAAHVGIDPRYAELSTRAWEHHKTGRDYWTPMVRAQVFELRAALQDPDYPRKPSDGLAGPGPEPMRYALAVELHDMHTEDRWAEAAAVMRPYYGRVLRAHRTD